MFACPRIHLFALASISVTFAAGCADAAQPRADSPAQPSPVAAAAAIADVPDDVDLIVVVEGTARNFARERIGEAVGAYIRESGAGAALEGVERAGDPAWMERNGHARPAAGPTGCSGFQEHRRRPALGAAQRCNG